jgi:hypothetical protein
MPTLRTSVLDRVMLALRPEPGEVFVVLWGTVLGVIGLLFSFYLGRGLCEGCGSGSINLCGPSLAPGDLACTLLLLPVYAILRGFAALQAIGVTIPGPMVVPLALGAAALAGALGGGAVAWWIRRS